MYKSDKKKPDRNKEYELTKNEFLDALKKTTKKVDKDKKTNNK